MTDTDAVRERLLGMRERLLGAARDLAEGDDEDGELANASGDHIADHASDMVDRELDDSLEANAEEIVREIDAALARLDDGTYGSCARCGRPIAAERLEAVPYAVLCIDCKRLEERP